MNSVRRRIEHEIEVFNHRLAVIDKRFENLNPITDGAQIDRLYLEYKLHQAHRNGLMQALEHFPEPEYAPAVESLRSVADFPWDDPDFIPCMS
jgi:hypothetical protein